VGCCQSNSMPSLLLAAHPAFAWAPAWQLGPGHVLVCKLLSAALCAHHPARQLYMLCNEQVKGLEQHSRAQRRGLSTFARLAAAAPGSA
jgi:hypothetical protein